MRNFKFLGAMLVFLVSLESCKGCAVGAGADAWDGKCPTGQINIDDGKTSAATSCKAVVAVADKNELVAEIQKATLGGKWTANLNYIDTSKVTDMSYLFADKAQTGGLGGNDLELFNGRIDKWNTSNVQSMQSMFDGAVAFNQDISKWDVSNVTDMANMFTNATAFNQPIGDWKVDKVTNMQSMFYAAAKFNQPIGNWKVDKVTSIANIFNGATAFDQDLSQWNPNFPSKLEIFLVGFLNSAMWTNNNMGKYAAWYCTKTSLKTNGCP